MFRTESETRTQLKKAGFQILEMIYDSQGIFPRIAARKNNNRIQTFSLNQSKAFLKKLLFASSLI
ncbi:hypothetical protein A1C_01825 [Rickettsia akari str. Hartford]|uniref:Uncharacterized protein n=1 Tax=Rickettsia akari (strain Hartford) TaxID=293614 RepID=A8GMQ1_RICAH|nr:hypothetical protein A1C_01825 [Rickettsia akari str. Hartford]